MLLKTRKLEASLSCCNFKKWHPRERRQETELGWMRFCFCFCFFFTKGKRTGVEGERPASGDRSIRREEKGRERVGKREGERETGRERKREGGGREGKTERGRERR